MEQENIEIDQERQERARAYQGAMGRTWLWTGLVFGILFSLVINSFKLTVLVLPRLRHVVILGLEPIPGWFPVVIFVDIVLPLVLTLPFLLPLSWYIGLVLPRRYGFSEKTTGAWLQGIVKATLRQASQFLLFTEGTFFFYALQPQIWWFWSAVIYAFYLVTRERLWVAYILPHIHPVKPLQMRGDLAQQLLALMERLGYGVSGISVVHFDTKVANAYYMGWGKGRYVLLTNTMLQTFTNDEIEVIVAHELGHMAHHDIWKRIALHSLLVMEFLGMLSVVLPVLINASALSGEDLLLRVILGFLLMLGFGLTIKFYVSSVRRQEYQADEFALQTTGKVQVFKNAVTRLANVNTMSANTPKKNRGMLAHLTLEERLHHADEFAIQKI